MVPTLKIDRDELKANGFINAYFKDGTKEVQYENAIYLLFRPTNLDKFKVFLDSEYERTKSVIDDYDYQDGFVVVVYALDTKFRKDFELVKFGKYSKTSKEFQSQFLKVVKITKNGIRKDEVSLQYRVFNKTEDMRTYWEERIGIDWDDSMEVWQGWLEEDEILFIDKLKEQHV